MVKETGTSLIGLNNQLRRLSTVSHFIFAGVWKERAYLIRPPVEFEA